MREHQSLNTQLSLSRAILAVVFRLLRRLGLDSVLRFFGCGHTGRGAGRSQGCGINRALDTGRARLVDHSG
jgi:hypothetical protein